tara:strand:+ start:594 stop:2444 length:1851 start_codon:yes stop_codon:yes gene_type:complete
MGNWKKIITSGSNADLLNITSSGGIQIGSLTAGDSNDLVLVRNSNTGDIETRTQVQVGDLGSNVNVFQNVDPSAGQTLVASSNDTLNFVASDNITITGDSGAQSLTFTATTKSAADITTILSQSLTSGTHQNITINEPSTGVFSITGSQNLLVGDTVGQKGIDLTYNSANNSLTGSLAGLTTESSVRFADITSTGNISASGFISASALYVHGNTYVGGDLTLDGDFNFDGFNFETSDILTHSGSNVFGSSSAAPSTITHQFTGSILVTGSGITLVGGTFTGDGSGLTNITAGALPGGLLSSSAQISNEISGAYTADNVTILKDGGEFSAVTSAPAVDNDGLSLGSQIFSYVNSATSSLSASVAANYISSIANATEGGIDVSNGSSGDVTLGININNLATSVTSIASGDFIAFDDSGTTKKTTVAALAAVITASSAGTVTSVVEGDGIDLTGDGNVNPTIAVDAGSNIVVNGSGVSVAPTLTGITSITATTGSFDYLEVIGGTTIIETETLKISDNFLYLNKDHPASVGAQDAGISINRGTSTDTNLFWDEAKSRWALSTADLQTGAPIVASPNAFLASVSSSGVGPTLTEGPTYGDTNGQGNMHVNTATGDIWMYV